MVVFPFRLLNHASTTFWPSSVSYPYALPLCLRERIRNKGITRKAVNRQRFPKKEMVPRCFVWAYNRRVSLHWTHSIPKKTANGVCRYACKARRRMCCGRTELFIFNPFEVRGWLSSHLGYRTSGFIPMGIRSGTIINAVLFHFAAYSYIHHPQETAKSLFLAL